MEDGNGSHSAILSNQSKEVKVILKINGHLYEPVKIRKYKSLGDALKKMFKDYSEHDKFISMHGHTGSLIILCRNRIKNVRPSSIVIRQQNEFELIHYDFW